MLVILRTLLTILTTLRNPWVYAANRIQILRKPFTYRLWNGLRITSRPFAIERSILNDVWFEKSYEPNAYGIPFDWQRCRTIVDIGANIGTFTLYAAAKAPKARIVAFEPEPSNALLLRENIRCNNLEDRVIVEERAIASKAGERILFVSERDSGGHSFFRHTADSHPTMVHSTTLPSAFEKHGITLCDFLKIDCEGAEEEIFCSLPLQFLDRIPFIALEEHYFAHSGPHKEQLREFLREKGFEIIPHRKSMFFAKRSPPEQLLQSEPLPRVP